jgi:hypothetical protein
MRPTNLIRVVGLAVLCACSTPLGPDRGAPEQFLLASPATFVCGNWQPAAPLEALGLFDVYFRSSLDKSAHPAASEDLRQLVAAGATVVSRFRVNGVRAILPVSAASAIDARALIAVRNVAITEHPVGVGFTVSGKSGVILAAGGRILWAASTIPDFLAIVPDAAVPQIWRDPDLRFLELNLPDCIGFN